MARTANARWEGTLKEGEGKLKLGSGAFEGRYSFSTRFEDGTNGTNPEELLGAAHAGCFTMALNSSLNNNGTPPTYVETTAHVSLGKIDDKTAITKIHLVVDAEVPGLSEAEFKKFAEDTKEGCIISRAINVPEMTVEATLK